MKRLHSLMFRSYLGPLIATFFISMFILLMQFLWRYIDELVGKGLDASTIAEFLFYVSVSLVPMALPLAVLLASIMTFGNLGENYELIACKAAGISLFKVMKPLAWLSFAITIFAFFFANNLLPVANLKTIVLLRDIRQQKPELSIKEGVFTHFEEYSIKVSSINKESGMMYDLIIYNHKNNGSSNNDVTIADSGRITVNNKASFSEFVLYNGSTYKKEKNARYKKGEAPFRRVYFGEQRMHIPMEKEDIKKTNESLFSNSYRMLNISQLNIIRDSLQDKKIENEKEFALRRLSYDYMRNNYRYKRKRDTTIKDSIPVTSINIDSLYFNLSLNSKERCINQALRYARQVSTQIMMKKSEIENREEYIRRYDIEWHKKFTLSLACIIFFFIGAPLGGIIRKGGLGAPVVISVVFFISYYIISMIGERSAREGVIEPWEGIWLSTLIILPLAIILTWKSVTDSEILNTELYTNFLRRFGLYKEKKNSIKEIKLSEKE